MERLLDESRVALIAWLLLVVDVHVDVVVAAGALIDSTPIY